MFRVGVHRGFRDVENQMEEKMVDGMEAGVILGLFRQCREFGNPDRQIRTL